jgi:glycosyltransferase involved in cell wall biosynthesis
MGWGKLEEEMRRIADSLKMKNPDLDQRIRFVPKVKQTELPLWTCGASLGAIPYENTGLNHWYCNPNKLWEYPNAGVPIIASPFPELRKTIEDNQIGWMLPDPLHPRDIAAVVNKLTEEDLTVASRNCREFIRRDNWDIYALRLEATYQQWQ